MDSKWNDKLRFRMTYSRQGGFFYIYKNPMFLLGIQLYRDENHSKIEPVNFATIFRFGFYFSTFLLGFFNKKHRPNHGKNPEIPEDLNGQAWVSFLPSPNLWPNPCLPLWRIHERTGGQGDGGFRWKTGVFFEGMFEHTWDDGIFLDCFFFHQRFSWTVWKSSSGRRFPQDLAIINGWDLTCDKAVFFFVFGTPIFPWEKSMVSVFLHDSPANPLNPLNPLNLEEVQVKEGPRFGIRSVATWRLLRTRWSPPAMDSKSRSSLASTQAVGWNLVGLIFTPQ